MSEDKPSEFSLNKELTHSFWWKDVLKGVNIHDRYTVEDLRSFFDNKKPQLWYYAASGADITPVLVAPLKTEHWFVDVGYNISHRFHRKSFSESLTKPFEKLGAVVELAKPWDEAWRSKKQTITIDGETIIRVVGGQTQDKETSPDQIDVIYTNPFSTRPGPDALIALKIGGFILAGTNNPNHRWLISEDLKIPLSNIGINLVRTVKIGHLHFPSVGKVCGTTDGQQIFYQIYQKSRPFTPEEEDFLQLSSSLWEIYSEISEFIFRFDHGDFPQDEAKKMEDDLKRVFLRYFSRIKNKKGRGEELINNIRAKIDGYFPEDGSIPKILKQYYLFKERNIKNILKYHSKASEIYRQIKTQI